jgi:hypothetical protein
LSRTPSSAGNQKKWTWSAWVKRGKLGGTQIIFQGGTNALANTLILGLIDDQLVATDGSALKLYLKTKAVFRDTATWYHIVFNLDTTQPNMTDRATWFVNGQKITDFLSPIYPVQNDTTMLTNAMGYTHTIGASEPVLSYPYFYFDGYLADINFVDSGALDSSYF